MSLLREVGKLLLRNGRQKYRMNSLLKGGFNGSLPISETQSLTIGSRSITINSVLVPDKTNGVPQKKAKVVIFDKDGTLICVQHTWSPWARKIAAKIEDHSGLPIQEKVFKTIGFCSKSDKVRPGLLAEATHELIQDALTELLVKEGISEADARVMLHDIWADGMDDKHDIRSITDTRTLFKILKDKDVKIAICTADSREQTQQTLEEMGVLEYVDIVVCGDDVNAKPKPAPHNAYLICDELGIDPSEAVMVGDTKADMGMGKTAKLGWNVGVLSGVGETTDLYPAATNIIESVTDLLPIILPKQDWQNCYHYSPDERILVEPSHLETPAAGEATSQPMKSNYSCVIFDLHGTILCTHSKYSEWLDVFCTKLEITSKMDLRDQIYERLGLCKETNKIKRGILNDGSYQEIKGAIVELVHQQGLSFSESVLLVNKIWKKCIPLLKEPPKVLHNNLKYFFKTLKSNGVKIAISTNDLREIAMSDLNNMDVLKYVDMIVCGDDPYLFSKESDKTTLILDELNVIPSESMLVTDDANDFSFSLQHEQLERLKRIGVLTGVGTEKDLSGYAHHVVPSLNHVFDHIFPENENSHELSHNHKNETKSKIEKLNMALFGATKSSPMSGSMSGQIRGFSTTKRSYSTAPNIQKDAAMVDYVIVGAGSAGSILTNRLSEDGSNKVMVLEAGPKDHLWNWKIHMPAALMYNLCDEKVNWYYHTEPEKHMNNRVMYWPRGRVWGGSSSLNAMVYIRGNALDYDGWESAGAAGWSYADCLPYFRKSQTHELGGDDYRGGNGPMHVSRGRTDHPLHHAFIEAGKQAGIPFTEDMNGHQHEGVGWMDMTINKGLRWSTSRGHLRPASERSNVKITSKALTTKILFDGTKAIGVEYVVKGEKKQVLANKEVILSGGAINSPQLLMLSGVGNADELKEHGINPVINLPGVGENLQDHLEVYVQQECKKPITLYSAQWKFPHNMIRIGLQWFANQTGDGATTHLETGGFSRGDDTVDFANVQYHFLPSTVNDHGREMGDRHAFQVHVGPMRPTSRGYLKLKSNNPQDHPTMVANYMSTEFDRKEMRQCVFWAREIFKQKAFDEYRGAELKPGSNFNSKEEIDEFIRQEGDSAYHPSCTCKMGSPDDPMAVVDPQARVLGLENLRVVDASIMPNVVSGNLNGPTCMVAEKCADIILGKEPLTKSSAPVWLADENKQVDYPSRWVDFA